MRLGGQPGVRSVRTRPLPNAGFHEGNEANRCSSPVARVHGYGSHEPMRLAVYLVRGVEGTKPDYDVRVIKNGWPENGAETLADADTVGVYCDGGGGTILNPQSTKV